MNETVYVYIVHSDINENNIYSEFETEEEAIAYARKYKDELTYVDKAEVALDEDGEIIEMFDSETIWVYDEEDDFELEEETNEFDIAFDEGDENDEEEPQQDSQLKQNWQQHVNKEIDKAIENILKFKQEDSIIANFYTDEVDKLYDYLQAKKLGADIVKVSDYNKLPSAEQHKIFNKMLTEGSFTIFISTEKDQLLPPIRRVAQVTETITYANPMVDDEYPLDEGINWANDAERLEFFKLCAEIGIYDDDDIARFKQEIGCTDENILQALRDYRAELGPDFKIADPELEREMAKKYKGIDFDALVEELEENEDMVECKECFDLVAKESCHKNEAGKYICEKCSKTLTESISELTSEQLKEMETYLLSGKDLYLEEYEQEYEHDFAIDIVSGELTYNTKTNTFDFCLGVYHASEDNNAEYPERHTDEEEYSFDTIEEVYDEFPEYLEDIYKWSASKFSKLEEETIVKCKDCGGELKDNKCTACNRDWNLEKCNRCGGEVKDGKCTHCDHDSTADHCKACGGEVENGKCTSCNELVENAIANNGFRTNGYRTALASYDTDDYDINVDLGLADEDDYEVVDEEYLLCPGQTVADLVVYLSRECGFSNIYIRGERSAFRDDIKTLKRFKTVPGNHDYNDYGSIEDRLVESDSQVLKEDIDPVKYLTNIKKELYKNSLDTSVFIGYDDEGYEGYLRFEFDDEGKPVAYYYTSTNYGDWNSDEELVDNIEHFDSFEDMIKYLADSNWLNNEDSELTPEEVYAYLKSLNNPSKVKQQKQLYDIFKDGDYIGQLWAFDEDDAVNQCYNGAFGLASSDYMFEAELIEDDLIEVFEEEIKMTRDELMDKEGTDDVELINAGRPEEERVELVEVDRTPWKKGDPVDPSVLNNSRYKAIRYNVFYGDYYVARATGRGRFEGDELQDTDIICVFKYGTVSPYKVLDLMTAKDFKDLLVAENIDHRLCNYEWLQNKIAPMTVKRHNN